MGQSPEDAARRRSIPAAVEAALWTLSSGRCYAPGCPFPVIYEVRPGVYQKNAQIAHIIGVKRTAARYRPCPSEAEARDRESFKKIKKSNAQDLWIGLGLAHEGRTFPSDR